MSVSINRRGGAKYPDKEAYRHTGTYMQAYKPITWRPYILSLTMVQTGSERLAKAASRTSRVYVNKFPGHVIGTPVSADLTCWCQGSSIFLEGRARGKEEGGGVGVL